MPVSALHPSNEDIQRLRRAAGLLTRINQGDPATTDPGIALLCLAATENLRRLGIDAAQAVIGPTQIADLLDDALASLAALSHDTFATTPVLDAAANVRAARALLTESR